VFSNGNRKGKNFVENNVIFQTVEIKETVLQRLVDNVKGILKGCFEY
jgi:hypothetical protein